MNSTTAITLAGNTPPLIIPDDASKDVKHRLSLYNQWLAAHPQGLIPDLAAYRDYLMSDKRLAVNHRTGELVTLPPLSPESTKAHLATIRGRYTAMLKSNDMRDMLYAFTNGSKMERQADVTEYLTRLENAMNPQNAEVKTITHQDRTDDYGRRLTRDQASALLAAPLRNASNTPLMRLRDAAVIALMLCTGIREAELCALDVKDLRQRFEGDLALHVRQGKGAKERLIPYGALDGALTIVDRWLAAAGITTGAVFRGFYKNGKRVREYTPKTKTKAEKGRLTVRAINQILDKYPISIEGELVTVNPHDLRRTYARRLYEDNFSILSIQQNLGHADHKTTEHYIGNLHAAARRPTSIYTFDLKSLNTA